MYNAKWTDDAREYIIRGSAGVGKTYFIENDVLNELLKDYDDKANYVERFFVSKYSSYEELFGGYMPMDLEKNGKITYEFMPGPMAKILKKAYMNADKNYVVIIDSLTNGNIYEILGNFFQLFDRMTIDDNYRKKHSSVYDISVSEEAITWFTKGTDGNGTGLSEGVKSRMAESGNKIFLPENLYVMCTENTSHRSRYVLDTAFKRRFKLVYINDEGIVYGNIPNSRVDGVNYDDDNRFISREGWNNIRKIINEKIAQITNVEDKQLTEHFVRFTEDDKIAMLDFITCVVSHLIEIEKRFHDDRIIYKEYQSVEKVMEHKNDIVEIFSDEIKNDIMKIMNVNE